MIETVHTFGQPGTVHSSLRECMSVYDWYGDVFWLNNADTRVIVSRGDLPVPPNIVDRAETATEIYIGRSPNGDNAVVVMVVGEVAIKAELGWEEAYLYYGMVHGSAKYHKPEGRT